MKKTITTPVLLMSLGALLVGILIGKNYLKDNHDVTCDRESKVSGSLVKGGVYEKEFFKDANDPFAIVNKDTIIILDIQKSRRHDYTYAKWTFAKWNDTTRFISSDISYLSENTKRIK